MGLTFCILSLNALVIIDDRILIYKQTILIVAVLIFFFRVVLLGMSMDLHRKT